jgi:hypothetical protein
LPEQQGHFPEIPEKARNQAAEKPQKTHARDLREAIPNWEARS